MTFYFFMKFFTYKIMTEKSSDYDILLHTTIFYNTSFYMKNFDILYNDLYFMTCFDRTWEDWVSTLIPSSSETKALTTDLFS